MKYNIHRKGSLALTFKPLPVQHTKRLAPSKEEADPVMLFQAVEPLDAKSVQGFREIKDADGNVVDVQDVVIKGYLSTWKEVTPEDRDGEYVVKHAFKGAIRPFMKNPILLRDHRNLTDNVAGSFTKMVEDDTGLYFEAKLSNSEAMKSVRRDVVDGHLKTTSMGGAFRMESDGKGIREVALFEGSLIPVPANPDARFTVKPVSQKGKEYLAKGGSLIGLKSIEREA